MIDKRQTLTVKKDISGTITDLSFNMADLVNDTESLTLTAADYLYVGFYKAFNILYVNLATVNANASTLSLEIWNGTAWAPVSFRDETKGLTRNGFISWTKDDMETSEIDGDTAAYIRLSVDVDTSAMSVGGINLLFCDKNLIKQEFYDIDKVITDEKLVGKMLASRNEIMDRLDQRGYLKYTSELKYEDLTPFDLHDVYQVRQAAVHMTLSKIFLELSDDMDDHWWGKYEVYHERAMSALALYKLDVDVDDDGQNNEELGQKRAQSYRWTR